eukprot:46787-Prymnesium_polylepis.1
MSGRLRTWYSLRSLPSARLKNIVPVNAQTFAFLPSASWDSMPSTCGISLTPNVASSGGSSSSDDSSLNGEHLRACSMRGRIT